MTLALVLFAPRDDCDGAPEDGGEGAGASEEEEQPWRQPKNAGYEQAPPSDRFWMGSAGGMGTTGMGSGQGRRSRAMGKVLAASPDTIWTVRLPQSFCVGLRFSSDKVQ